MLNKRFKEIILRCQRLRDKFGYDYEEECERVIKKYSAEIIKKDLINKCENAHFAKQLCIMNCLLIENSNKGE
jgi:hypothetical protein